MAMDCDGEITPVFTLFPRLPTELRLKIWHHARCSNPQRIYFHCCKSDLDYLRSKRPACHNYTHVFASRMKRVPSILHVCREAREVALQGYVVGFGIDRMMASGRGDTDIDAYTTCVHEISASEKGIQIYWQPEIDTLCFGTSDWVDDKAVAYVWGGKTGVRFGKIKTLGLEYESAKLCGMGEQLFWEGIERLVISKLPTPLVSRQAEIETQLRQIVSVMLKKTGLAAGDTELKLEYDPPEDLLQSCPAPK